MAGKGGGAWKVAYADFVTAMMAFFLVMWLISQDQKVKESIAHYFQGPVGINLLGDSTRNDKSGGLYFSEVNGPVPNQTMRASGRSIGKSPGSPMFNNQTMVVADWVLERKDASERWQHAAREELENAREDTLIDRTPDAIDKLARRSLARRLREDITQDVDSQTSGMFQDLLSTTLTELDWDAIAEELLMRCRAPGR